MDFRIVGGCPCPALVAPYYAILVHETGSHVESIYRGDDARDLLHRHGKHTQSEVIALHARGVAGFGPANPVNESSHCLFNDGIAVRGLPIHARLEEWEVGFDVRDEDVKKMIDRAAHYGWVLRQPYTSGSEFHHLNFARRPVARNGVTRARIVMWRARLPRR